MDRKERDRLIFKALGDRTRFSIVLALAKGEMCACDLPKVVGRAQPTVSLQLKYLSRLGVLRSRREGKLVIYRIADDRVRKLVSA